MTHSFPASAAVYRRSPRGSLALKVVAGSMPADLGGLVYAVAPTGRHAEGPGRHEVIPFLNGDGTVYRVALGAAPQLDWALAKPPCHWAEHGTEIDPKYRRMRFRDWGITRLSDDLDVGGRNLLNTALQAVRFGASATDRLILTYESGRPFEIDPETLEVITPIGKRENWEATMFRGTPFEVVAATSHPAFDPGKDARGGAGPGVLFMVNYVREVTLYVRRLLRLLGVMGALTTLAHGVEALRRIALREVREELDAIPSMRPALRSLREQLVRTLPRRGRLGRSFTQLLWWDGEREPSAVTLLDERGKPLEIVESAHQMAVTESYVVIVDAAFKFELDLVIPYLEDLAPGVPGPIVRWLRERLSRIQPQATRVHLVPRARIAPGATVKVKTITLDPCSSVHYFVDYDDAGGTKVVLHAIDNAATDSSEFLVKSDRSMFPRGGDLPRRVLGMMPCAMDVDRIARWEIDGTRGRATRTHEHFDEDVTWTVALATGPGVFTAAQPSSLEHLWVYTHGFLPDAMSELVWRLYDEGGRYTRRQISIADLRAMASAGGRAPRLARYQASAGRFVDSFAVPAGWLVLSPQYVPVAGRSAPDGYLFTSAFGPGEDDKEIWIFDAADLARGPLCKLRGDGEELPWGYTLHTTWIERAVARAPGGYRVPVEDDLPGTLGAKERQLVDEHVRPNAYR